MILVFFGSLWFPSPLILRAFAAILPAPPPLLLAPVGRMKSHSKRKNTKNSVHEND